MSNISLAPYATIFAIVDIDNQSPWPHYKPPSLLTFLASMADQARPMSETSTIHQPIAVRNGLREKTLL